MSHTVNESSRTHNMDISVPKRIQRKRITAEERNRIWKNSGKACYLCKESLPRLGEWHIEHVVPFVDDPKQCDVVGNMLAACAGCNLRKGTRSVADCVDVFALELNSSIVDASHLNSDAKRSLMDALQMKHEQFHCSTSSSTPDIAFQAEPPLKGVVIKYDEKIGEGAYSEVLRGSYNSRAVAIKLLKPHIPFTSFVREITSLQTLRHPHIVSYFGHIQDAESYGLVLELCPYHLSSNIIQRCCDVLELLRQAASALDYIHSCNMVHRDVKPMNILVLLDTVDDFSSAKIKLADFGVTAPLSEDIQTEHQGTAYYRAPETRTGHYEARTDMYAFGMTMQQLRIMSINKLFRTSSEQLMEYEELENMLKHRKIEMRLDAATTMERLLLIQNEHAGEEKKPSVIPPVTAVENADVVYVARTASIVKGDKKRRNMKYHRKMNCCMACVESDVATAARFGHEPCAKCCEQ